MLLKSVIEYGRITTAAIIVSTPEGYAQPAHLGLSEMSAEALDQINLSFSLVARFILPRKIGYTSFVHQTGTTYCSRKTLALIGIRQLHSSPPPPSSLLHHTFHSTIYEHSHLSPLSSHSLLHTIAYHHLSSPSQTISLCIEADNEALAISNNAFDTLELYSALPPYINRQYHRSVSRWPTQAKSPSILTRQERRIYTSSDR